MVALGIDCNSPSMSVISQEDWVMAASGVEHSLSGHGRCGGECKLWEGKYSLLHVHLSCGRAPRTPQNGVAALVSETTTTLTTKWQNGHGTLTLMTSLGSEEMTFLLMMRYNVNKSSSSSLGPSLPHWHRKKNMIGLLPFCPKSKPDTLLWRCGGRWQR